MFNFCPFTIYTGDAETMTLKAVYAQNGDPLDLTDCTEIVIALPNADGTSTLLRKSVGSGVVVVDPAVLGKFSAAISSDVSEVLNVGELQSFNVTFTIGPKVFTVPYVQALSVLQGSS